MTNYSRTFKSLKNAKISLLFYLLNLILQFFSRKIFLDYLGTEVLGLNTTAMNLLQFLNLAELGISSAISYSLYKPLADGNKKAINEIVSVQGFLYRRIALIIIAAAILLMCFFPLFFRKIELPLWYAYATFIVFLVDSLVGYFFNYHQIILTADQKDYKLNYAIQTNRLCKVVLQMVLIVLLPFGYIWWLLLELVSAIISVFAVKFIVHKEYVWLQTSISQGKKLKERYPGIITKTKQLFFHKIGGFVLFQTSPLIIYAYASMTLVAIYGNYMLVITGVTALFNAVFYSTSAGVGNLIAEGDKERIMRVFKELFSARFFMVASVCFGFYILVNSFISLWVGKDYLIDQVSLSILVCILYINLMRNAVDSYIYAYGLFQDVYSPLVEAVLNITLSILLGYFYGLPGILSGVLISLLIVIFLWKPYFLFRFGLKESIRIYFNLYFKHLLLCAFVISWVLWILPFVLKDTIEDIFDWILQAIVIVGIFSSLLLLGLYICEQGMRDFVKRLYCYFK